MLYSRRMFRMDYWMKLLLVGLLVLIIGFAIGFESGTNWTKVPEKDPIPEWYRERIMSYTPGDIMEGTIPTLGELKPEEPNEIIVKEPHEKLQPKLFKSKKGYKNE